MKGKRVFHDTSVYGTLWYRRGELPWPKWFAFGWLFRSVPVSVIASAVFAGLLLAVVWLVAAERFNDGRLDFGLVLTGCVATSVVILVIPTVVAKSIISNLFENSEYRFGPMLGEGSWRYKTLAPSLAVLRAYEGATRPFEKLSDGTREVINEWLVETWDDDNRVWKDAVGFGHVRDQRRYWRAIDDRVESFLKLPIANEPAVGRVLRELSRTHYLSAFTDARITLANSEKAMLDAAVRYQRMTGELLDFAMEAPEGTTLPEIPRSTDEVPKGIVVIRASSD